MRIVRRSNFDNVKIEKMLESFQNKDYKKTVSLATSIIDVNPDFYLAIKALAFSKYYLNDSRGALDETLKLINLKINDPQIYNLYGNILKLNNNLLGAEENYLTAIKLNKNYYQAINNVGVVLKERGLIVEAIKYFQMALKIKPDYSICLINLGNTLKENSEYEEALSYYKKAEIIEPLNFELLNNLGVLYKEIGQLKDAIICYQKALKINPNFAEAHNNLGNILKDNGDFKGSILAFKNAIRINPQNAIFHENLGLVYSKTNQINEAIIEYEKSIEIESKNDYVRHILASLKGLNPKNASAEYISKIFDKYANNFEDELIGKLKYDTPNIIYKNLVNHIKFSGRKFKILDLGCGTGLAGLAVQSLSEFMLGVDLSEKMLLKAKEKNIYNKLLKKDIYEFLLKYNEAKFDVVLSSDVFVYIGDLKNIFSEIYRLLEVEGLFVFSVEASLSDTGELIESQDYILNLTARYSHSKKYLERISLESSFKILDINLTQIRLENDNPVLGYVFTLCKPL